MTSQGPSLLSSLLALFSFLESGASAEPRSVWGSGRKEAAEWDAAVESRDRNAGDGGCESETGSQAPT